MKLTISSEFMSGYLLLVAMHTFSATECVQGSNSSEDRINSFLFIHDLSINMEEKIA